MNAFLSGAYRPPGFAEPKRRGSAAPSSVSAAKEEPKKEEPKKEKKTFVAFLKECDARSLTEIFEDECRERNVLLTEAYGSSRTLSHTSARHACWRVMRAKGFSSTEIAALWDRDHTTILAANELRKEKRRGSAAPSSEPDLPKVKRKPGRLSRKIRELEERVLLLEKRLAKIAAAASP